MPMPGSATTHMVEVVDRVGRGRRRGRTLSLGSALLSLLLVVTVLGAAALSPSSASAASAALRRPPRAQGLWDGGDNWEICHGSRYSTRPVDYAIGDIQRDMSSDVERAAYVRQVNACMSRRSVVYLRPMHEINGSWYPWSRRTPYEFRRDFCSLKRFWRANSTTRQWSRVRWVLGLNHGTSVGRGRPSNYFASCADLVGVSMYLRVGYKWKDWVGPQLGLTFWQRFANRRRCGSMYVRALPREHTHRCGIAASEWGVQNGWHDRWRNDISGYVRSIAWMSRWVYQAPLCGDGTPWINPNTGRPCPAPPAPPPPPPPSPPTP